MYCGKRCVLEQKLLLTAYRKSYEKSIDTKMNDLVLCLEVVSRLCQSSRHIRRWISRKPLEIEAWLERPTNRKWHIGYHMTSHDDDVTWSQRCCEAVRWAILVTAWLLVTSVAKHEACRSDQWAKLLTGWLGGVVVRALESWSRGRGFDSCRGTIRATTLGKLFTPNVPLFTKQYNLVPCDGFHANAP